MKIKIVLASLLLVISIVYFIHMVLFAPGVSHAVRHPGSQATATPGGQRRTDDTRAEQIKARADELRAAPSLEPDQIDRLPRLIDDRILPPLYEPERLTDEAREVLVETLVRYTRAWLSDTPELYMEIVQSENTTWRPPDDRQWKSASQLIPKNKAPIDPTDPETSLRRVLEHTRFSPAFRWVNVLYGPSAILILTDYDRTKDEFLVFPRLDEGGGGGLIQHDDWYWYGVQGVRLRDPEVKPQELMQRDLGLLTAKTHIAFVDQKNRPSLWVAYWYWDPSRGVWNNYISSGAGPYFSKIMIY